MTVLDTLADVECGLDRTRSLTAPDRSAAAIMGHNASGTFDDLGALVAAVREMLSGAELSIRERGHLYCLACMAEDAWGKLDDAIKAAAK